MIDDDMSGDDIFETRQKKAKTFRRRRHFYTEAAFSRRAEHYLGRFSACEDMLRQTLQRQCQRYETGLRQLVAIEDKPDWLADIPEPMDQQTLIEAEISRCRRLGYVDDVRFARARAVSLYRRGTAFQQIRQKLRQKGVLADAIEAALQAVQQEVADEIAPDLVEAAQIATDLTTYEIDLQAARQYAKRRRLGPYRRTLGRRQDQDPRKQFQKDLSALCRAGFSWNIAEQIMQPSDATDHRFEGVNGNEQDDIYD